MPTPPTHGLWEEVIHFDDFAFLPDLQSHMRATGSSVFSALCGYFLIGKKVQ